MLKGDTNTNWILVVTEHIVISKHCQVLRLSHAQMSAPSVSTNRTRLPRLKRMVQLLLVDPKEFLVGRCVFFGMDETGILWKGSREDSPEFQHHYCNSNNRRAARHYLSNHIKLHTIIFTAQAGNKVSTSTASILMSASQSSSKVSPASTTTSGTTLKARSLPNIALLRPIYSFISV